MLNRRADKLELLRIAEAVALEKSIDKELIKQPSLSLAVKMKFKLILIEKMEIYKFSEN